MRNCTEVLCKSWQAEIETYKKVAKKLKTRLDKNTCKNILAFIFVDWTFVFASDKYAKKKAKETIIRSQKLACKFIQNEFKELSNFISFMLETEVSAVDTRPVRRNLLKEFSAVAKDGTSDLTMAMQREVLARLLSFSFADILNSEENFDNIFK